MIWILIVIIIIAIFLFVLGMCKAAAMYDETLGMK